MVWDFVPEPPYLYHFDALGSTVALTNANGTVTDTYDYDPWGNLADRTGSTEQPYQYVGQLGYYTHYQDDNVDDLLQLGVRFHEPGVGRFTQKDVVRSTPTSAYLYAAAAPTAFFDPGGGIWCKKSPNGKIECHWGLHPDKGGWVVNPPDWIWKRAPEWARKFVEIMDLAGDSCRVFDKGKRCGDAFATQFEEHPEPLYEIVVGECVRRGFNEIACRRNSDRFMWTCKDMFSQSEDVIKRWIGVVTWSYKRCCKNK